MKPLDIKDTATLVEHLTELRRRLIIIIVVNLALTVFCYQYIDILIQFLLRINAGMDLIYIAPEELFMVYIKLSLMCAVIFCFPLTAMQIWMFIAKGLYPRERFYGMISLIAGVFFFLLGAVFCYLTVLPVILQFFIRITIDGIAPMISIESYISFCTTMLASFGAAFEMPVIVYLLSELGLLKPDFLKKIRGVLVVLIFLLAAVITPPDVLSQVMLAIPMILLLQLSIWICQIVYRRKMKRGETEPNEIKPIMKL